MIDHNIPLNLAPATTFGTKYSRSQSRSDSFTYALYVFCFSSSYASHSLLTAVEEQGGPPSIPLRNEGERANAESPHPITTTVHAERDGATGSVDPVKNQDKPLLSEDMPDPVDVTMHEDTKDVGMDLLSRIPGLYRLLDLISEQGSGGAGMLSPSSTAQRHSVYLPSPLKWTKSLLHRTLWRNSSTTSAQVLILQ